MGCEKRCAFCSRFFQRRITKRKFFLYFYNFYLLNVGQFNLLTKYSLNISNFSKIDPILSRGVKKIEIDLAWETGLDDNNSFYTSVD